MNYLSKHLFGQWAEDIITWSMLLFPPQSARQYEAAFRQHYDSFTVANLGEPNRFGQDCYDAAWILALALNNTLTGMVLYAVV